MQTNIKYTPLHFLKAIMYECFLHHLTEIASVHLFLTENAHTDYTGIGLFIMTWSCALYSSQSSQDVISDTSVWIFQTYFKQIKSALHEVIVKPETENIEYNYLMLQYNVKKCISRLNNIAKIMNKKEKKTIIMILSMFFGERD